MTEEATIQQYQGVLCWYCRQPIPVPGIVGRMVREDTDDASKSGTRVFNLRCRACEKEKQYHVGDIVEFEGSPRPRSMRTHVPLLCREPKLARAANG